MEQELLTVVNNEIQQAVQNALTYLSTHQLLLNQRTDSPRCRSLSSSPQTPFRKTISRYSEPLVNNGSVQCETMSPPNNQKSKRLADIQYSFSLHQPFFTKAHDQQQQQQHLMGVRSFVDDLVDQSIESALYQVEENEPACSPETLQALNLHLGDMVSSLIQQMITLICSSDVENLSNQMTKDIMGSALSIVTNETTSECEDNDESLDSLVDNLTERIYTDSTEKLKKIFMAKNDTDWM
ncbi:unnamed protein product [Adineta ricciae]|uniref:Uncharacterized protein n=1 Tax=Adineta ricciae TaxID=249248 RepID=A0A813ZID1_ADIRI|nr:unnamed protein product [Adineta ricciae]